MAEPEVIVIDDSSDAEAPDADADEERRRPSSTAEPPPAKRARLDGQQPKQQASLSSSSTGSGHAAVITPASAGGAAKAASTATSANLEAKKLDSALAKHQQPPPPPPKPAQPPIKITEPRKTICDVLRQSHSPAPFSSGGECSLGHPGLCVGGLPDGSYVSLPVLPAQATALTEVGTRHPVDGAPLHQWLPNQFSFRNPKYASALSALSKSACEAVGIDPTKVRCDVYKLLLHGSGGKMLSLNNATMPGKPMVASLVILLPSLYTGGAITVRQKTKSARYDFQGFNAYEAAYFFNFGAGNESCTYEIDPIQTGSRLMLIYNVVQTDVKIPRIVYRDEARLLAELVAAAEVWDTAREEPVVYMTKLQYASSANKSALRGEDAKVARLLDGAIRGGADLEWDVASVEYTIHGDAKKRYAGGRRQNVFGTRSHDAMELRLSRSFHFSKIRFRRDAEKVVYPQGHFDGMTPTRTTFQNDYYYDTSAKKIYANKTCIFIWPRSQTYQTLVSRTAEVDVVAARRVLQYVEETSITQLASPAQEQFKKVIRKMLESKSGYSLDTSLIPGLTELITRFDDSTAAKTFLGYLGSCPSSFKTEFVKKALPPLVKSFGSAISEKLAPLVKSLSVGAAANVVIQVMDMSSDAGSPPKDSTQLAAEMLLVFAKRVISACNESSERYEVLNFAKTLGCFNSMYYHDPHSEWPEKGVGKILVYMCKDYSKGSDVGKPSVTAEVMTGFIGAIGRALASSNTSMPNQARIDSIFDKLFSKEDLEHVSQALHESQRGSSSLVLDFVNKLPLEVRAEIILKTIEESKGESPDPKVGQPSDKVESAVMPFALSLVRGSSHGMQNMSKELAISFTKSIVGDGSDEHHESLAKSLKCIPSDGFATILCFLCDLPSTDNTSTAKSDTGSACTTEDLAKFVCALGHGLALDQSGSHDGCMFDRMFTKSSLRSVVKRCGHSALGQSMGDFVERLDYGAAATFVVWLSELDDAPETPEELQATQADAGILVGEVLRRFAKHVVGSGSAEHCQILSSVLAKKNRDDPGSSTCAWPLNSIGLILRRLCKNTMKAASKSQTNNANAQDVTKFIVVTYRAIALDRSSTTVKSESNRSACKRLLSKSDVAVAFEHCGLATITECLEGVVEGLSTAIAADFILQLCDGTVGNGGRATSSAATLASVTAEALVSFAPLEEVHFAARKLLLAFVRQRMIGDGSDAHFAKLAASLGYGETRELQTRRSPKLIGNVLHYLCKDDSSLSSKKGEKSTEITTDDILGFIGAACKIIKTLPGTRASDNHGFHENTFFKADFEAAIKCCGFDPIGNLFCPIIEELLSSGQIPQVILLLSLLMSGDSESQRKMSAPLVAKAVVRVLPSPSLADNKAFCVLLLLATHFEVTCNHIWDPVWMSSRPAQPKIAGATESQTSSDTSATAQLTTLLQKMSLDRVLPLLIEAETLFSMSGNAAMKAATKKSATILEQVARRAIPWAEEKVNAGPTRPRTSWRITSGVFFSMPSYASLQYRLFLQNPCEVTHEEFLAKDRQVSVKREFRDLINTGVIGVSFFQRYGRGRWLIRITKKKQVPLPSLEVPSCSCVCYSKKMNCALWKYHNGVKDHCSPINQGAVEGLKDSRAFFELLSKGLEPPPEIEVVDPPPAPEIELVDLCD